MSVTPDFLQHVPEHRKKAKSGAVDETIEMGAGDISIPTKDITILKVFNSMTDMMLVSIPHA
jgi:hypothetical protein